MIKGLVAFHDLAYKPSDQLAESFAIGSTAKLFRFPVYRTREAAQAAGLKVPAYTTDRPVKSWVDPNPPQPDEDGFVSYLMVATTRMGCGDTALVNAEGKPYIRSYKMTSEEPSALNIPPKGDFPDPPQPKGEWNIPCRTLAADEELVFGFGAVPVLQKKGAATTLASAGSPAAPVAGASFEDIAAIKLAIEEIQANVAILVAKSK